MTWAVIIAAILEVVGPYIAKAIQALIAKWLHKGSNGLQEPTSFGRPADALAALFDRAIASTPTRAFATRVVLRAARRFACKRAVAIANYVRQNGPLPTEALPHEIEELKDAAEATELIPKTGGDP
jgi:hypothetical protein